MRLEVLGSGLEAVSSKALGLEGHEPAKVPHWVNLLEYARRCRITSEISMEDLSFHLQHPYYPVKEKKNI
jgi:hypothetical protein